MINKVAAVRNIEMVMINFSLHFFKTYIQQLHVIITHNQLYYLSIFKNMLKETICYMSDSQVL